MKMVFLTPDRSVDRRIILEAESIRSRGHEVVIIADLGAGKQDDRSYPGIRIINAIPGGDNSRRVRMASARDSLKAAIGGNPSIRRALRKAYFNLFHAIQISKPRGKKLLCPLEECYYDRAVEENGDIYVACDLPMLSAAYRASLRRKAILIYDAHEFYTEQCQLSYLEKKSTRSAERWLIQKADCVITINESIASLFEERYDIKKPIIIYNCTTSTIDRSIEYTKLRDTLALAGSDRIVLFQGGYLPGRNLENLVLSAEYFNKGIVLVLLGFGEFKKRLVALARKSDNIRFLDAVSQDVLLSYTASADLGIIPYQPVDLNTRFCTPNKLFEFIQAGLPLLADMRLEELQRFIERERIGYLRDLRTPERIARAVNDIFSDPGSLSAARIRCNEIAPDYSWSREGEKLAEIVSQLLEKRKYE